MTIGTSLGKTYDDEHHYAAAQWDPASYDDNGLPSGGSTELAGASKSSSGTPVAPEAKASPEPSNDYDYASWQKANPGVEMAPGQHYPDTYKLPNHMTFSNESIYHGGENQGGQWGTDEQGKDTFTPGPTNLKNHTMAELQDYFKRVEPDAKLLPPDINDVPRHDWVESFFSHVKDAFKLPGDVFGGKVDPTSQQGIEKAIDLAGLMVGGPAPVAAKMADGTLGSFAGVTASKNLDIKALGRATIAEREGATADEIWKNHGFFRGVDNRWRYEIPDEGMKLTDRDWKFGETGKLSDFIDHPELYKAYPKMKDINFKVGDAEDTLAGNIGGYSSKTNTLMINPALIKAGDQGILDTASHELQHWVQREEGFNKGSNPDRAFQEANDALRDRIKEVKDNPEELNKLLNLHLDILESRKKFGEYLYQRKPGEVEANTVMARRQLPEALRKAITPQDTVDMLEGSKHSLSGGTYMQPFMYPKGTTKVPIEDVARLKDLTPETVKSAAIKYKDELFEAHNHGMALNNIVDKHPNIDYHGLRDGFTTTHGRFISREEAFQLAAQKNQVDSRVMRAYKENQEGRYVTKEGDEPMLLSEDLSK